jgi:hypothetical protein
MVSVEDVGIQVHPVRPHNRAGHVVDPDLPEDVRIAQRVENTALENWIEVELPDEPIREGQAQLKAVERNRHGDPRRPTHVTTLLPDVPVTQHFFDLRAGDTTRCQASWGHPRQ